MVGMKNTFKIGLVVILGSVLVINLPLEDNNAPQEEIVEFEVAVPINENDTTNLETQFVEYEPKAKEYSFECNTLETKPTGFTSPKKEWDVESKEYIINNNSDTIIRYKTGSVISIPKNSFQNKKGNAVDGHVTLKYREFHNALEVAMSGIPMNLGDTAQLLSGGMFEITAQKEGGELSLKMGSNIKVQLATSEKGEQYDYYFLNGKTNTWELKGDLKVDTSNAIRDIANQIRWWSFTEDYKEGTGFFREKGKCVRLSIREHNLKAFHKWGKKQRDNSKATFFTVFSKKSFPHYKNFKYLKWELLPENDVSTINQFLTIHKEKKEGSHSIWSNLSFSNCENDMFYMHFSSKNADLVLKVKPSSSRFPGGKRFDHKQERLENRITAGANKEIDELYKEAIAVISEELKGASMEDVERFLRLNAIYKNEIENLIAGRKFKLPNPVSPYLSEMKVVKMGVHNCDNAVKTRVALVAGLLKAPAFMMQEGYNVYVKNKNQRWMENLMKGSLKVAGVRSVKEIDKIVMVHKGVNTVNSFTQKELNSKFFFSRKETSLGLVFLSNGEFKLILPKQFKKQKKGKAIFKFESVEVASQEELIEYANELGFDF
jgi:hypothetical protein